VQVPADVNTRVLPLEKEHPAVPTEATEYVSAPLALAVAAESVAGVSVVSNTVVGDQLTVCIAGVTVTDTAELVAAAVSTSASIVTVTVQVPLAVAVNAAPETVHVPEATTKVLAPEPVLPDDDSRIEVKAVIDTDAGTAVMVWAVSPMVTAALAEEAEPVPIRFVAATTTVYVFPSLSPVRVTGLEEGDDVTVAPPSDDVAVTV